MIDHLSYSSISSYLYCGANWRFKYIDQIKTPTSPELIFGSTFHATVEGYLREQSPVNNDMLSMWNENWAKQIEGQEVDWGTDIPESFCNEGIRLLSNKDIQDGI